VKRQAEALLTSLREFIAQPDYPTLVVSGTDAELIFPNRALASFDRQDENAYYLLFPQPCVDAPSYMNIVAQSLTGQLEVLNTELAARSMNPVPELPLAVNDTRYPPQARLRAAVEHLGTHLPGTDPIVWGLLPGTLADPVGYRALVGPLLAEQSVEPWMDRHRFLLRDQEERQFLLPELKAKKNDRVLVMNLDFSNERWVDDLVKTASNKSLPAEERVNAFFLLATVDFGFRRFPQALEKYGVCFNFFAERGDTVMQSLCLTGAADTTKQAGRPEEALRFYQQSLALGVEQQNLPIIQQGAYGAGVTSLELNRDRDAEGYLKHADDAAAKMYNPYAKCDAMEKRGLVAWRLGKIDEAIELWTKGKELAKQFFYNERAASILDWLIALSRQSGLTRRVADFEAERATLGVPPRGAAPGQGGSGAA
jgi:tetratricopeptide (TPR) repeat protein